MIIMSNIFRQWFGGDWYWLSAILSEPFDSSFNGITASCWKQMARNPNDGWSVGVSWRPFAGCRLQASAEKLHYLRDQSEHFGSSTVDQKWPRCSSNDHVSLHETAKLPAGEVFKYLELPSEKEIRGRHVYQLCTNHVHQDLCPQDASNHSRNCEEISASSWSMP